jgi:hypothetical protein
MAVTANRCSADDEVTSSEAVDHGVMRQQAGGVGQKGRRRGRLRLIPRWTIPKTNEPRKFIGKGHVVARISWPMIKARVSVACSHGGLFWLRLVFNFW